MADTPRPEMVFARVQLRAPSARTLLFVSPRGSAGLSAIASGVALAAVQSGTRARLLDITGAVAPVPNGVERMEVLESELTELERARRALQWPLGMTVASAGGVLEAPSALVLSVAADAVVLVARQGRTMRSDMVLAREEIVSAGGRVVGSLLLP